MGQQNQRPQNVEEDLDRTSTVVNKWNFAKILQKKKAHRRLPLEMECEIFKYLKLKMQQKLIYGMGRGIYGMFSHRVLTQCKRVENPVGNRWRNDGSSAEVIKISRNGMKAVSNNNADERQYIFAEQGFPISVHHCRRDNFPGTILYYFEVKVVKMASNWSFYVGLSDGNIPEGTWIGHSPNCYFIQSDCNHCWLSMEKHDFPWPNNAFYYGWKWEKNVVGCGLLLKPDNNLAIFFTVNGKHCGRNIPIKHPPAAAGDCCLLYPTVHMRNATLSANFGDNTTKPFKFQYKNIGQSTVKEEEEAADERSRNGTGNANNNVGGEGAGRRRLPQLLIERTNRIEEMAQQQQQQRPFASQLMMAKCDYDTRIHSPNVYAEDVELSFRKGDIIRVYGAMDEDGFYLGELNGIRGLVPSNLLQPAVTENSSINET